jgi:hypothetical protein
MRQSLQRAGAFLLLSAAAGVLATSCAANESSIFIRGCLAPTDNGLKGCTVTFDASSAQRLYGRLDPAQADYHCALLVGNQLVARGDAKQLRTETSRVELHSAVVTIYDSTKSQTFTTFTVPATGFVDPGTASQPGFGGAETLILDRVTARAHPGETLLAGVIIQGRTLGGLDVESAEWTFAIEVLAPGGYCDLSPCFPGAMPADMLTATCQPGVDTSTDCRQGCGCLPGFGDCAPLGCRATSNASGVCAPCVSNADCTAPAKCGTGKNAGFCL